MIASQMKAYGSESLTRVSIEEKDVQCLLYFTEQILSVESRDFKNLTFSLFIRSIPTSTFSSSITTTTELVSTVETLARPNPIQYSTSISEVQETIEYLIDQCCSILSETLVIDNVQSITTDLNSESKRQRRIMKLERRLHRLSRTIRELEEKDMSLDEMAHCDLYEVESNLKKEACQVNFFFFKFINKIKSLDSC